MAFYFLALLVIFFLLSIPLLALIYLIVRPRPVKIPLKNRHVFITGGSSKIGLAVAHQAAAEGARVSILARSVEKLEEKQNKTTDHQFNCGLFLMAFLEVVTAGIARIASLCFQWTWYRSIEKWHAQPRGSENPSRSLSSTFALFSEM